MRFKIVASIAALAASAFIFGCASRPGATASAPADTQPVASAQAPSASSQAGSETHTVKSRDGRFNGEVIGTPAKDSKFAKLRIGMRMREVTRLIGAPDDMSRHETGKRWIPFYYGNDAQRLEVFYRGEGCLTYTGGNVFGGGGNELIRITVDQKGTCFGS